ncbi:Oligosaccharide translocation protein rft1 [Marasmius crinis-equi]|uniref:Man(5)GlcNAc(2)-PP-dolichol translocation protein RFT1 n=1 Tax=Marasmius crinis-equi TaxID=585013 RepID=A0ABR3FFU0_9AGAR
MSTTNSHDASNLRSSSLSSLTSLVGLQLSSRLLTFILNQALFRLASPKAYGVAAIQFELVLSTILFLSREGVRGALLRIGTGKEKGGNRALNVGFVPVIIGIPLALCTTVLYASYASAETKSQGMFRESVAVYALAAILELMAEPMHNMAMAELKTHIRVRAEGVGITFKTIVTFIVLFYDYITRSEHDLALLSFALGQLAYGACVFAIYAWSYNGFPRLRGTTGSSWSLASYFDMEVLTLSMTMTSQSLVKHFLTEGDKFILSWFSPLEDQGGYAVAVNYGSLIARIIFQPIEETLRLYFSKTLSDVTSGKANTEQKRSALSDASRALIGLLHIQVSASLFVLCFGTQYLALVLQVFLPAQYLKTSAPRILSAWIWYIPVLAINGGLEAFLASAAGKKDVNRQSGWMIVFSFIYIGSAVGLYRQNYGDVSLVYANIINLSARIAYVVFFSTSFFRRHKAESLLTWRKVFPSFSFLVALLASLVGVRTSETTWRATEIVKIQGRRAFFHRAVIVHVGLGATLALASLGVWWRSSREFLSTFRSRKAKTN